ncbi:cytochrome P450 [Actinocrispum wychmicini]|nr:cytochrome P450 [Actinocrispum wychmicini]
MSTVADRSTIPGPRGLEMWRLLLSLRRDPLTTYLGSHAKYGDIIRFHEPTGAPWVFIAHPDMVAHIHQRNHRNYGRGSLSQPFALFLGDGLLTSERETWSVRRRLMAPHFRADHQDDSVKATRTETSRLLDLWASRADTAFDVCHDLERLTFRIVLSGLFGMDLGAGEDPALRQLTNALTFVSAESFRMYPLPAVVTARRRARFAADIRALDAVVTTAVERRIAEGHDRGDLLDTLIAADLGPRVVRDELLTMLHAGQHTVASSIAFTLYLLSTHQDIQDQVHAELARLGGRPPGPDDLSALPFLHQVFYEVMRLYPPAWGGVREALDDDELGGHPIPAGTPLVFSQYVTHRHPEFWPEANKFEPGRFTEDASKARHRYAYFPFGGGPHLCIGQDMALVELSTVVAMVVQRFRLSLAPGATVKPKALLDLVPANGVPLVLRPRREKP